MGRFVGRRPDRTAAISRAVRDHLEPAEEVLAGVDVQVPGTHSAALHGGVSGATGAAAGGVPPSFRGGDTSHARWLADATSMDVDPAVATRLVWAAVALTSSRLIVLRRSRLTRRVNGLVVAWPIGEIERIEVPRQGRRLTVHRRGRTLTFELAVDHRFRPAVYDELPLLLDSIK